MDIVLGGSFILPLLTGVYKRLSQDSTLRAMCPGGIHDGLVETNHGASAKMPYVIIGETDERMKDTLNRTGSDTFLLIEVFSNYRGSKEVLTICDRIHLLLHRQEAQLETPGWCTIMMVKQSQNVLTTGDNNRHGIMRFRVKGQPTP
jgi:hypothetical protein